jgi:glutaredoxin
MEIPTPQSNGFTIYSKSGCTYCVKVKNLLKENGEPFLVVDCDEFLLEDKPAFLQFMHLLVGKEYKTFPMVFLNGNFIGGFSETQQYYANAKLAEKELKFDDTDF